MTRPAGLLRHPVMVAALVVLIVNDHVLKARFHNLITGKLSDLAGLALFPVLLASGIEVISWLARRPPIDRDRTLELAAGATAVVFAAIQAVPAATDAYAWIAGLPWGGAVPATVVPDLTDLLALPAVMVGRVLASAESPQVRSHRLPAEEENEPRPDAQRQRQLGVGPSGQ